MRRQGFKLGDAERVTCQEASGGRGDTAGTVACPIELEDLPVILNILVVPTLSEPVIFGVVFLKALGIALDRGWLKQELKRLKSVPIPH